IHGQRQQWQVTQRLQTGDRTMAVEKTRAAYRQDLLAEQARNMLQFLPVTKYDRDIDVAATPVGYALVGDDLHVDMRVPATKLGQPRQQPVSGKGEIGQ